MNGETLVVFWAPRLDQNLTLQVRYFRKRPRKSLKSYENIWRLSEP